MLFRSAIAGNAAGQMIAQTGYTAFHKAPWHWQVPAYLVTKAVGAGALGIGAVATLLRWSTPTTRLTADLVGIVGLLATTVLLVSDLERPERFLRILTRPQWRSWLTRGAFLLVALSIVATGALGLDLYQVWSGVSGSHAPNPGLETAFAALLLPLSASVAAYTAFLFAQCEGRDLWQSPLLPVQLLARAAAMGGAVLTPLLTVFDPANADLARGVAVGALAADLLMLTFEVLTPHPSETAARALRAITRGKWRSWALFSVAAHALAIALLVVGVSPALSVPAALAALAGLYAWEHAFVAAPQEVPNS